jgi:hypothetical protein
MIRKPLPLGYTEIMKRALRSGKARRFAMVPVSGGFPFVCDLVEKKK